MNSKNLLITSFVSLSVFCIAQNRVYTTIQKNKNTYPGKDYFFPQVVDLRPDQSRLGFVCKMGGRTLCEINFKKSLSSEVYQFFSSVFPNRTSSNQVLITVNVFEIGQILSKKDSAFVKLDLDFYLLRNDSALHLSHYARTLCEATSDAVFSHPNRIKRALLLAAGDLERKLEQRPTGTYVPLSELGIPPQSKTDDVEKSEARYGAFYSRSYAAKEDSSFRRLNYPDRMVLFLGAHANLMSYGLCTGVNVNWMFRLRYSPKYLVGINVNHSAVILFETGTLSNYESYRLASTDLGFRVLKQIKNITFINVNTHFLVGKERFTSSPSYIYDPQTNSVSAGRPATVREDFFFGMLIECGGYLLQPRGRGFFIGADLTFLGTTSFILDNSAGVKLTAGYKF